MLDETQCCRMGDIDDGLTLLISDWRMRQLRQAWTKPWAPLAPDWEYGCMVW